MAASIVVDIKAQITGYQEQIAKIQQALSKVKLDSSIGKELTKELENAQKILNNLGKNTNIRLSSESGIDQLTDKLESAGERIRDITQLMGKVKFEDLDVSKLGSEFTDILKKVQELQAALDQGMGDGIQKAINDSETLKKTFTDLGADITKISADSGLELLNTALKTAQEEAANAKAKVEELNGAIEQQKTALDALNQNPFLSGNFNLESTIQQLKEFGEVLNVKSFDQNAFNSFKESWLKNLETFTGKTAEQKEKIKELITNFAEPSDINNATAQIAQLFDSVKSILGKTSLSTVFGSTDKELFIDSIFHIDQSQLNEAIAKIEEIKQKFGDQFSKTDAKKIPALIDENNIKSAAEATIRAMQNAYGKVAEEQKRYIDELQRLTTEQDAAKAVQTIANTNVDALTRQITELRGTIDELTRQFNDQKAEIIDLKQKLAEAGQNAVQGLQEQVKDAGDASAGIMNNAREAANMYKTELDQVQAKEQFIGKIEGVVQRWFSVYAAVRMVGQAIRSVISTVQELDKTITQIAIVTNMTQQDLWGQMKSYTDMARQYAVSISGVYEVSQLYYQQGLQTADVMALTEETLKMARISGLDYATATDYMTNAVRSFKMEMQDAQTVVDVYSEIAASSATNTAELATAMSKTASSAQAVGSSFENTTAMMAVMIEATRESAENIGSAMKSIISRYGEMTKDPSKLTDSEGEAMSLNKVDKALQTVGIAIHDAQGQFRDFDDVITELAGKWDTIDKNTQRYIATVMAGNRQQSRFLALVSNGERLAELSEKAANSQDAATLQVLKTMDSIEAKTQQLKTTLQSLYVDSGIENMYKGILDFANNLAKSLSELGTVAGIPIEAIGKIALTFMSLSNTVTTAFGLMRNRVKLQMAALNGELTAQEEIRFLKTLNTSNEEVAAIANNYKQRIINFKEMQDELTRLEQEGVQTRINAQKGENSPKSKGVTKGWAIGGAALSLAGTAISGYAANLDVEKDRQKKAVASGIGTMTQLIGLGASMGGIWGAAAGAGIGAITGAVQALGIATEETEEKITRLGHAVEATSNKKLQSKDDLQTLVDYKKKYDELVATRNKDAESREEWIKLNNDIAASYPELISQMDAEGNSIVDMTNAYENLLKVKRDVYQQDFLNNIQAELNGLNDIDYVLSSTFEMAPLKRNAGIDAFFNGTDLRSIGEIYQGYQKGSEVIPSTRANADTYASVFGIKNKKELEGFDRQSSGEVLNNYRLQYDQLINLMYEKASEGLSKAAAVEQIMTEHPELEAFSSNLEHFDQSLYNYFLSLNSAITYQQQLIDSKISQGNAEWLQALQGITGIEYNDIQFSQLQNAANEKWKKYQEEYAKKIEEDPQKYHEIGSEVDGKTWSLGDIYSQFIQEELDTEWYKLQVEHLDYLADETINELYKNLGKSNRSAIKLGLGKYANISEEVRQILLDEFDKQYEDTINNFKEHINKLKTTTENIDLQNKLTALQLALPEVFGPEYLNGITAQFESILNNTEISDSHKNLQFDGLTQIYTEISKLDENLRQSALSAAEGADFTSLTGIYDFIKSLEDTGIDLDATGLREIIHNFGQTLNINFETEVQSYIAKVTSGMEDFDKALNSASKGMDFKTASELANKLGKSLTEDFDLRNGQYFFSDFAAIRDKFLQVNDDYLEDLEKAQKEELAKFNKIKPGIAITEGGEAVDNKLWKDFNTQEELDKFLSSHQQAIEDYSGLDISTISNAWQQWHQQAVEGENNFVQWLSDEYGKQYAEAVEAGKAYANQRIASIALSNGNIDAFLEAYANLGKTIDEEAAIAAFNSGDIDELVSMFPDFASTLIEKYQNISLDIYDKMLAATEEGNYITVDPNNTRQKELLEHLATETEGLVEKTTDENVYKLQKITEENIDYYLKEIDSSNLTSREKASERAKATNAVWEDSLDKLLQDIYKDVDSVSQETYEKLVSEFGLDAIQAISKDNGDNTHTINVSKLQQIARDSGKDISDATFDMGENAIQETTDDIIKQISTATSLATKGSFSPKEMQDFATIFKDVTGEDVKIQDIFKYDEVTKQFKLNSDIYSKFIEAEREKLKEANMSDEQINEYINNLTNQAFAAAVDFQSFYGAEIRGEGSQAYKALESQMRDFFTNLGYNEALVNNIVARRMQNALSGGNAAVQNLVKMAEVTGEDVTSSQVEEAYRAQVAELENAFDQLSYGIDSIISGQAVEILDAAGYGIDKIEGTNSAVITSIGKISDAYAAYYEKLAATGEATIAALNEAKAMEYATKNSDEAWAIDALGDAAGMTYQRLGEILAERGKELTNDFIEQYTEALGPNKVKIADFSKFATEILGITDFSTPEYISAFKTYNDSLIQMNHQAERNIIEEVNNLSNAKGGDWVNLTQLTSEIGDELTANLQAQLAKFGGILDNGILQLEGDANLSAIINTIISTAQQYGGLLDSDMAALADALDAVLKSYSEKISKGIKGGLSNVEALDLQNLASSLDQNLQLNFIEAQDGLRLAQKSAIELHRALQKVDSMQAQLTFDALSDSLKEHNEHYENVSTILAHIADLQDKINNLPVSDARRKEYEAELEIAERIMNVRSSTDPDSFKFMDRKMPDAFNSPINYWDAAGKAYTAMNESAKSGYMEIQDFYNIINEMSNMAAVSGESLYFMGAEIDGSAENAAKLIQQGMSALTNVDGKGVKIALNNLAGDFQVGASDMSKGFDSGIKEMARAQISMLDAQIQMLEAIVAMEKLGDIDLDSNGIDYEELFEDGVWDPDQRKFLTKWDQNAQTTINEIVKLAEKNPELQKAFESLYLGQYNLWEYLNDDGTKLTKIGQEGREKLVEAFNIIKDLAASDEFDLGDVQASVDNLLRNSGLQDIFAINYFNEDLNRSIVVKPGTPTLTVDWSDWTPEKLKSIGFNGKDPQQQAKDLLTKFVRGGFDGKTDKESIQGLAQVYQLTDKINVKKVTEVDDKGNKTEKDVYEYGGKSYDSLDEIYKLIAAEQQLGGESGSATIEGEGKEEKVVVTKTLGKITYKISANEDGTNHYDFGDFQCDAANENDAIHQYYLAKRETTTAFGGVVIDTESEEEFKIRKGIKIAPEYQVTGDFKNSPEAQSAAKDILNKSNEAITNLMKENEQADGSFKVPVGDVEFQLPPGSTAEDFKNKLRELLGMDVSLITEIAEGIKTAFSEGDAASQIGTAIATGMTTALAGADGKTQEVPIPEITIKPSKINFDTTGLAAAAKEQGSTATPTEIPIDSIKVKPSTIDLDASGAQQPTGEGVTIPEIPLNSAKATVNTLELTSVTSATLAEGVEPNLKDIAAKGDASSLELTLTALGATLAGGNTVNIEGAINSKGEVGTLAVTLAEGKQGTLEHTGDVDVGNVGSVSGTSDDAKISATNYTVTFTKEDGSTEIVEVEGNANLTAILSKYGIGFDENGNLTNTGEYNVTVEPTNTSIDLTTTADMTGADTDVTTYENSKVLKLKTNLEIEDPNGENSQAEQILSGELNLSGIEEPSQIMAQLSEKSDGAVNSLGEYVTAMQSAVDAGKALSDVDYSNLLSIQNSGLFGDISGLVEQATTLGSSVAEGLVTSMTEGKAAVTAAGADLPSGIPDAIDETVQMGSPSHMAEELAATIPEGLIAGMESGKEGVESTATSLGETIKTALTNAFSGVDFNSLTSSLLSVRENADNTQEVSFGNFGELVSLLKQASEAAASVWDYVKQFSAQTFTANIQVQGQDSTINTTENKTTNETINTTETHTVNEVSNTEVNVDTSGAQASAGDLGNAAATMGGQASAAASNISGLQTALSGLASAVLLLKAQTNVLKGSLSGLSGSVVGVKGKIDTLRSAITSIPNNGTRVSTLAEAMKKIPTTGAEKITNLSKAIGKIPTTKDASVTLKYSVSAAAKGNVGNAQAKGNASALVAGTRKTLMGELGPELVVSNGRYYVVGQNGAEFVDLAKDAIVFNHKQTKRLLEQGMIGSRGRPITNENNAISFAKGKLPLAGFAHEVTSGSNDDNGGKKANVITEKISSVSVSPASETIKLFSYAKGSGPALASAAAALAALKELRAMWQSLLDAGAKELGSMAGRNGGGSGKGKGGKGKKPKKGGGGGGGGSGDDEVTKEIELGTITEEIQRWYDLLRQIDKLEQDISYQQALRKKYESDRIANGEKIYNTYQKELGLLAKEIDDQKQLAYLQKSWYDAKRAELAETSYSKIFTYTEDGLQQYTGTGKPGSKLGLDILETLTRRDAKGKYALNVNQQLNYLKKVGFDLNELRYNDDGTVLAKLDKASVKKALEAEGKKDITDNDIKEKQAEIMTQMMENFWSRVDGWRDELDSLYDSYNETATNIQENITKQNEILQQLVDNELSVEKDIYEAIEAREQAEIDRLKEEKELLNNTTDKIVNGLNNQLSKEKEQYNKQKESDDLGKLQRQLAILQRSGGSASQIRTLQQQIDSKMQDQYFSKQEESINNIKEAADKQIERLEQQIDIQTQILDYQKANGLIWEEVRYMMENLDEDTIISHIKEWNPKFNENSTLQVSEDLKDIRERLQIYLADKTTKADKEEGFKQIDFESNENTNTLNKIKPESQTTAKLNALYSAKEAYNNAIDTGKTKEEATKIAQSAYTESLKKTQATEQGQSLEQTKQNILAKENEGKKEEEQKTVSTAETKFNNYIKNDSKLNALSNKQGYYTNLSSAQKAAFEQSYYDYIAEKQNEGLLADEIDYDTALKTAYNKIEEAAKTDATNGFNLTKNGVATYNRKVANKKTTWTKAKSTLSKSTKFKITGIDGKFVQIQAIGNNKNTKYWVPKSVVPSSEITAYNTKKDKTTIQAGTAGIDQAKNYESLKKDGLSVSSNIAKGKATLGKNIKYKDVAADGRNVTPALTDSKGKTTKQIKSFHIKSINGLKSTGAFSSVVLDKINDKPLTKAYTMSSKVASNIKVAGKSLTTIIQEAIKKKVTGSATKNITYKFATGGMADFTGPAWLDGTKKKPEAVLNADQTRFLKEDLLGNSSNSLMSIVSALQDSMNSTYTSSVDNSNSVVIENISLNFEAGTISNDYDARRAGDTVVKEILKIARKTGNNSVSRR